MGGAKHHEGSSRFRLEWIKRSSFDSLEAQISTFIVKV